MADIKETAIVAVVTTGVFVGVIGVARALKVSPFQANRVPTQPARVGGVRHVTGRR